MTRATAFTFTFNLSATDVVRIISELMPLLNYTRIKETKTPMPFVGGEYLWLVYLRNELATQLLDSINSVDIYKKFIYRAISPDNRLHELRFESDDNNRVSTLSTTFDTRFDPVWITDEVDEYTPLACMIQEYRLLKELFAALAAEKCSGRDVWLTPEEQTPQFFELNRSGSQHLINYLEEESPPSAKLREAILYGATMSHKNWATHPLWKTVVNLPFDEYWRSPKPKQESSAQTAALFSLPSTGFGFSINLSETEVVRIISELMPSLGYTRIKQGESEMPYFCGGEEFWVVYPKAGGGYQVFDFIDNPENYDEFRYRAISPHNRLHEFSFKSLWPGARLQSFGVSFRTRFDPIWIMDEVEVRTPLACMIQEYRLIKELFVALKAENCSVGGGLDPSEEKTPGYFMLNRNGPQYLINYLEEERLPSAELIEAIKNGANKDRKNWVNNPLWQKVVNLPFDEFWRSNRSNQNHNS